MAEGTSKDSVALHPAAPWRPSDPVAVIALLDRWLRDESGYEEESWPELKEALHRDRLSERKPFDE
jgi:hypothetical protein